VVPSRPRPRAMADNKLTPKYELLVDGSAADPALLESILSIRVEQHLELADSIEVRLSNESLEWTEGDMLKEGVSLTVKLGHEETELTTVANAEVVRRDCDFPERGPSVVTVVAYDREHRLKRGIYNRVFTETKVSDVVSQMASDAGLTADVEDTQIQHPFIFQCAQSNLAFIREQAMLHGFVVDVDRENSKISFKPADAGQGAVTTLKWGDNLLALSYRSSTDESVNKVVVRGWDLVAKKAVEASADKGKVNFALDAKDLGSELAKKVYGEREVLYVDVPVTSAAEAQAHADARINALAMRYCQGEASCQGTPEIDAGSVVAIEGCGERVSGSYFVFRTLHHLEPASGYTTHFDFLRAAERLEPQPQQLPPQLPIEQGPAPTVTKKKKWKGPAVVPAITPNPVHLVSGGQADPADGD